jgi:hypothetical protein
MDSDGVMKVSCFMTDNVPSNATDSATRLATSTSGLAPAPLIAGEDTAAYDDLMARLSGTLKPSDVLEEIWVRDVVDLVWEVFRLRRLKTHLMRAGAHEGMAQVLKPLVKWATNEELAQQWWSGQEQAVSTVESALASAGLGMDAVMAYTLAARIDVIERVDRMMMAAEVRRDNTLSELDRRRVKLAQRLRDAIREAEEAEFEVIPFDQSGCARE